MPVIGIPLANLKKLIGKDISSEALTDRLLEMGCDVEGVTNLRRFKCANCNFIMEITQTEEPPNVCDQCNTDFEKNPDKRNEIDPIEVIRMELLAVRPDMFDTGGLARAVRGYLNIEKGIPSYKLHPATTSVSIDPDLSNAGSYRPHIVCAVVKNVRLDDDFVKIIMKLQENLHWALGRNRKLASIGVYNYDSVNTKGFKYKAVAPEELRFIPLGYDMSDSKNNITPKQILEEHPKGKAFAHLLEGWEKYPLLTDCDGNVLSMPPIINSENTKITIDSSNFFIDVTGPGPRLISRALNILVTSMLEVQPDITVEQVQVIYPDGKKVLTPDFSHQSMELSPSRTTKLLGIKITDDEMVDYLKRMRHDAIKKDKSIQVKIPSYRNDIMHERDLMEDVAIAYGYHNITPLPLESQTYGMQHPKTVLKDLVRTTVSGLGFFEVTTLMLTGTDVSYQRLCLDDPDDYVKTLNPVTQEQSILRTMIFPGIMETLSLNVNNEMPQKIFEIGEIIKLNDEAETGIDTFINLCAGIIGPKVSLAEIQAYLRAVIRELGADIELAAASHPSFIEGRAAKILLINGSEKSDIGVIGEVHPQVLENFKIIQPVSVFEINLDQFKAQAI